MKPHERMTKAELIRCIKALEKGAPATSIAFERERLLHDLQVHQVELETQNRELREAQHLLELSRDRYADLYDFAPVGYVTLNDKGVIREINLTAAGMLGAERSRLVGVPFHLHVAREDLAVFRGHLAKLSNPEDRVVTELNLIRKHGGALPVVLQSALVFDAEKKGFLCRTALTDITARKQADLALRESAALNRAILCSLNAHIAVLDMAGRIIAVNDAWSRFARTNSGYSLARTGIGTNYLEVCREATDTSKTDAQEALEGIQKVLKRSLPSFSLEYVCHSDQEQRWFQMSVTPLAAGAGGAVISHLDISERKRAEEKLANQESRLRAILATAAEGIITIDERGIIESFNPAAEQMFGYNADEAIGQNVKLLVPASHHEDYDAYLPHRRQTGERQNVGLGREMLGRRRNGETFPLELSLSEVALPGRRLFTAFVRDITARKRLEKEVLEATEREQNRIGHDLHDGLCQHLAGIEFRLLGLKQRLAGKANKQAAEADELTRLVRQAIEQTRTLARGLSPVMLDPGGLMNALHELATNTEKVFNLSCQWHCPAPVLIHDNAVAAHLYRITQEAIQNAIRHGKARQIRISLFTQNDRVVLAVKDDGIGFPKKPHKHDGIGIRVMQYRAGMVGGSLVVQHLPEGGTTVICSLHVERAGLQSPSHDGKRGET